MNKQKITRVVITENDIKELILKKLASENLKPIEDLRICIKEGFKYIGFNDEGHPIHWIGDTVIECEDLSK